MVDTTKLGYTYPEDEKPKLLQPPKDSNTAVPVLSIGGVNRSTIRGSFVLSAWAASSEPSAQNGTGQPPPKLQFVGAEPVLSRWHVSGCANCQNHLSARAHIPLEGWDPETAKNTNFQVMVHTRESPGGVAAPGGRKPTFRVKAA